jgi:bacterioferritin-associated ferredoxin
MIVCICNNISEQQIKKVIDIKNISHIDDLREEMSVCNQCCMCENYIKNIINNTVSILKKELV